MNRDLISASSDELRRMIERRVLATAPDEKSRFSVAGVAAEQQAQVEQLLPIHRTQAAVLVPLVDRPAGLSLLFTQRPAHMRRHAGQISFPGGRVEASDAGPLAAALRETEEEIGLLHSYIHPVGYLQPQLIFTGYRVMPVVGFVKPDFELRLDSNEVDEVFEVPFRYFLDPTNHHARKRMLGELAIQVYDFSYAGRHIWGATASIILSLYQLLQEHRE
ncbi:MAG: CoA pyrophosphatase [Steroidobacteraceae bacterium]